MYTIGSLCTGYGGLDMAVERVLGGEVVYQQGELALRQLLSMEDAD